MKEIAIDLIEISKKFSTFEGTKTVLQKVSLCVHQGECVVLAGENGSGKSVLMSIIAGLQKKSGGKIFVNGKVALIFQDADIQILGETVKEDVSVGLKNLKIKKDEQEKIIASVLQKVGLLQNMNSSTRFLSGGQKRRLAIACMLAVNSDIFIFDEPYANLDYSGVKQVNKIIGELKNQGKTIIILTHEIEKCLAFADKFAVLHKGQIVFDGSATQALECDLEQWNIKNPLNAYKQLSDLVW